MPNARQRSILHFHFIVFLFGFTSILGALIQIDALPLVTWRMGIASGLLFLIFLLRQPQRFLGVQKHLKWLIAGGLMIGVHWITFFYAIKIAGVSLTLSMMASGAFLTALLEPLFYKKKIVVYELFFGALALLGLLLIFNAAFDKVEGILIALLSAVLSVLFTLINANLAKQLPASTVTLYELSIGFVALFGFCFWYNDFSLTPFYLQGNDWIYLLLLGTVCTAYAFIVSVQVMKQLSPFTVMIIINMEPIYGILMALLIFGEKELMSTNFYIGVLMILLAIASNGYLKSKQKALD
jgi:drug/metabolite transporter (DMT)-like permease